MNSENSGTYDPQRLLLNITDEIDLRRKNNILLYQVLVFVIHGKISKSHKLQHGMNNLNYLMDHVLYQIFKIILNIY